MHGKFWWTQYIGINNHWGCNKHLKIYFLRVSTAKCATLLCALFLMTDVSGNIFHEILFRYNSSSTWIVHYFQELWHDWFAKINRFVTSQHRLFAPNFYLSGIVIVNPSFIKYNCLTRSFKKLATIKSKNSVLKITPWCKFKLDNAPAVN